MKKTLAIIVFIFASFTSLNSFGQATTSSSNPAFGPGNFILNPGIGFGYSYGYLGSFLPAIGLSGDYGLKVSAGPGTIGVGGVVAFKFGSYDYGYYGYDYSAHYSETIIAVRASYHWTPPGVDKLDLYAGIPLGVRLDHYSEYDPIVTGYDVYGNPIYKYENVSGTATYPFLGLYVGASYYFSSRVGVFAEVGYAVSAITIGLNFKLK